MRISAPIVFAHVAFGPIAARFAQAYPEVQLEIVAEDRRTDPVDDGYDLVIRVDPAPDKRLVGRRFLRDERLVVAPAGQVAPTGDAVSAVLLSSAALGAAVLPKLLVANDVASGRLAFWGPLAEPPVEIWALQSARRLVGAKVRAFLAVVEAAFPDKIFVTPA